MIYRCLTIVVVAVCAVSAFGQADHYTVLFDGIIMHDMRQNRALVIRGTDTMPHDAVLITPSDIDVTALYEASGRQSFQCDSAVKVCRFHIDGMSLRVGTMNPNQPAPAPLTIAASFSAFTPHMSCITYKSSIDPSVYDPLPSGAVVAYFEMTGGTLTACNFKTAAFFVPDIDLEGDHYVTDIVTLDGSVSSAATGAVAALQVKSAATHGKWVPIGRRESLLLKLIVENHAHDSAGQPIMSNKHFAINHQLILTGDGKFPSICLVTGEGDDPACKGQTFMAARRRDPTDPCTIGSGQGSPCDKTQTNSVTKMTQSAGQSTVPHLDLLAGCANSQWP